MRNLPNETILVQALNAGDKEAFVTLYHHYSPQLYINILSLIHDPVIAEELVQELFTRIWQKKAASSIDKNFSGYLFQSARNLVHDHFRKLKRDRKLLGRFKYFAEANYTHIEEALAYKQSSTVLKEAVEHLTPQQKRVYELVKIEGCSYKRAADIMGISPLTVKEYLVSVNRSLKKYFMNQVGDSYYSVLVIAFISFFI